MKLVHYTDKEFILEPRDSSQNDSHFYDKPTGLWVSVEGEKEFGWKERCEGEKFNLESLLISYEIILKKVDI